MGRFDDCLSVVYFNEGGVSNDPADHGGLTNYGVTQAVYDAYRRSNALPVQPVNMCTMDDAGAIYRTNYWAPSHASLMPVPIDLCVFDTAVNSGVVRASKILQACLGVAQDGDIGAVTLAAIAKVPVVPLAAQFCDQREAFFRGIVAHDSTQARFLTGWLNRNNYVRRKCGLAPKPV